MEQNPERFRTGILRGRLAAHTPQGQGHGCISHAPRFFCASSCDYCGYVRYVWLGGKPQHAGSFPAPLRDQPRLNTMLVNADTSCHPHGRCTPYQSTGAGLVGVSGGACFVCTNSTSAGAGQLQQSRRATKQFHWQLPTALSPRPEHASTPCFEGGPRKLDPGLTTVRMRATTQPARRGSWVPSWSWIYAHACMQLGCCNHLSSVQAVRGKRLYYSRDEWPGANWDQSRLAGCLL